MTTDRETILGIDFGTSYTSAAALVGGKASFVLDDGDPLIPSVVHIPDSGPPVLGTRAVQLGIARPDETVTSIKRVLGRLHSDPEVRALDAGVGYRINAGPGDMAVLEVRRQTYAPAQIVGWILDRVRQLAERRFGGQISRAVMSVPVAASPAYTTALRQAARFAGLEVLQTVPEPIAGGLALGLNMKAGDRRLAVCDFGGGTFDVTLLQQHGGRVESVAVAGDAFLGGDDFDDALANGVAATVFHKTNKDMRHDIVRWRETLWRCESIKRRLSSGPEATLSMKDAFTSEGRRQNLQLVLERTWAEERWQPLIQRAEDVLGRLMAAGAWDKRSIDDVLLIGGTSLIPVVQRVIGKYFGRAVSTSAHAHVAVTLGAAIQTASFLPSASTAQPTRAAS